ncbi:MAG TPA: DUF924 family protein [Kofleriaceae bacterium]|nr:DUF924 family protein [Kofleriaceae bacterium]
MRTPDEVLDFWFGDPPADEAGLMAKVRRWYRGGPDMDREVIDRFGDTVAAALRGELDGWADRPRGRLALVIVLDQFTRNTLRDQPGMYSGDASAQRLAVDAFDRGWDAQLPWVERLFLLMPLLHAEDLELQRRACAIAARLAPLAEPPWDKMAAMNLEQTAKYLSIIERFGRFPHRNALLGRTSTEAEAEFLKDWDQKQAPRGAPTG